MYPELLEVLELSKPLPHGAFLRSLGGRWAINKYVQYVVGHQVMNGGQEWGGDVTVFKSGRGRPHREDEIEHRLDGGEGASRVQRGRVLDSEGTESAKALSQECAWCV